MMVTMAVISLLLCVIPVILLQCCHDGAMGGWMDGWIAHPLLAACLKGEKGKESRFWHANNSPHGSY
jgi:hypothetical protein